MGWRRTWTWSWVALAVAGPAGAQFANPGVYVSPDPASTTEGPNVLFFGNSYTISSENPAVNTPAWGGARGLPELVRQIAIGAGHPPPFVKNVYRLNRGLDYHMDAAQPSLANIDEPLLAGEEWDFVVLQGFSTRPTLHPYTGNAAQLGENVVRLFEEVRAGATNHTLQSPDVVPVLFQTWAREPDHWFYDTSSPFTSGHNIAVGLAAWTGGTLFTGPQEMAAQVRAGYARARERLTAVGAAVRVAPVGDAWEAAAWGPTLYAGDHYHAASAGDLLSALVLYGTLWADADTESLVTSGALDGVLAALGIATAEAAALARNADLVLSSPPPAAPFAWPPRGVLIDFSHAIGTPAGPEDLPVPGRRYNSISDFAAGAVSNAVDTLGVPTGIGVLVTDGFADETSGGATGEFIGAQGLGGSLYHEAAQRDSFFVGEGLGYADGIARLEVRGLDPDACYRFAFHGSRNSAAVGRVGHYTIGGTTVVLDAAHNLNLRAVHPAVVPDAAGTVRIEVTSGGLADNFAYLGMLEITEAADTLVAYCTAKVNSCGGVPAIAAIGAPSASAASGFVVRADGARGPKPGGTASAGLLLYSGAGANRPAPPFHGGFLCLSAPLRRTVPVSATGGQTGGCDASLTLDFNAFARGQLGGNPAAFLSVPGQGVSCQWWGRDTFAHGDLLTDALDFTLCP